MTTSPSGNSLPTASELLQKVLHFYQNICRHLRANEVIAKGQSLNTGAVWQSTGFVPVRSSISSYLKGTQNRLRVEANALAEALLRFLYIASKSDLNPEFKGEPECIGDYQGFVWGSSFPVLLQEIAIMATLTEVFVEDSILEDRPWWVWVDNPPALDVASPPQ